MNRPASLHSNPLTRLALSTPPVLGTALALIGRVAGAALALGIALDQDYDRTRALGFTVAALALLTLIPVRHPRLAGLTWIGAGVLLFSGALLAAQTGGKALIVAGAVTALGAALCDAHAGRRTGAPSFFTGLGVLTLTVVAIIFTIEG